MTETAAPERFDLATFFDFARKVGHGRALGLDYCDSGDNWAELSLPWREQLVGIPESGFLASGAIISLIDTASGASVWMTLGKFVPIVTLDLRLDYLRPALKGETIFARCECVKMTRRIAFIRGIAHAGDPDKVIAHSTATFMLERQELQTVVRPERSAKRVVEGREFQRSCQRPSTKLRTNES